MRPWSFWIRLYKHKQLSFPPQGYKRELLWVNQEQDQLKIFLNGGKLKNINCEDNDYRIYDLSSNFLGLGNVSNNVLALKRLV